jgi:DNA-binding transcriptional MerR regulator
MPKPKNQTTVSDLIRLLGISRKTLYNWEAAGKIPRAKRDPMSRYRYYLPQDVEKIKRITKRG